MTNASRAKRLTRCSVVPVGSGAAMISLLTKDAWKASCLDESASGGKLGGDSCCFPGNISLVNGVVNADLMNVMVKVFLRMLLAHVMF